MHTTALRTARTILAAAALLGAEDARAHPDLFHWMEALEPETVVVSMARGSSDDDAVVVIELAGSFLEIELRRVELVRPDAADPSRNDDAALYRGIVREAGGGDVALSIAAGRLSASIRRGGELLFLDAPEPDPTSTGELRRGGDPFAGPSRLKPEAAWQGSAIEVAGQAPVHVLEVAAVADFEYSQKFGGGATGQMLSVLNLVDAIYLDQIAVTLDVTFTNVFTDQADPFSDFNSANLFNNYRDAATEFGALRDASGGPFEAAGLAHLFSDRNLNVPAGNKINAGFGFIDVLCDADRGVSISTAPTVATSLHALIVAHEFGHNFGAPHDSEGTCTGTPAGQFIMSPSATGNSFSACSKSIMTANRDDAACIDEQATTTTTTTTTTLPPASCGDANGDGNIVASDALLALRTSVGQLVCLLCRCDADGSGAVSAPDALRILRFSVSQPVTLLCPAC